MPNSDNNTRIKNLMCCNQKVNFGELWLLQDFKGYTGRKLFIGKCNVCKDDAVLQIMTKVDTGITYYNLYNHIEAVKTMYREKHRKVAVFPNVKSDSLYGWIYGVNREVKNKNGKVIKIRQYASDFKNNKTLTKEITV